MNSREETPFNPILLDIVKNRKVKAVNKLKEKLQASITNEQQLDLLNFSFATALLNRLDTPICPSIIPPVLSQHLNIDIAHYSKVYSQLPMVQFTYSIINQLFMERIKSMKELVLFDIGNTNKNLMKLWLISIRKQQIKLSKITIVSFLTTAHHNLESLESELQQEVPNIPFTLDYLGKHAQAISTKEWEELRKRYGKNILISASFSLHIPITPLPQEAHPKTRILRELKKFEPVFMTLGEMCVNFEELHFVRRFFNAWEYIKALFEYIDLVIGDEAERIAMKMYFRAMVNQAIGIDEKDTNRMKHNNIATWKDRLGIAGFSLCDKISIDKTILPEHLDVDINRGSIRYRFQGVTLAGLVMAQ